MVKPLDYDVEILTFEPLDRKDYFYVPAVHSSAFKENSGKTAQFFANFTEEDKLVKITLDKPATLVGYDFTKTLSEGENEFTVPSALAYMLEF